MDQIDDKHRVHQLLLLTRQHGTRRHGAAVKWTCGVANESIEAGDRTVRRVCAVRKRRGDAMQARRQRTPTIRMREHNSRIADEGTGKFRVNENRVRALHVGYGHSPRKLLSQIGNEALCATRQRSLVEPAAVQAADHLGRTGQVLGTKSVKQVSQHVSHPTTPCQNIQVIVVDENNHFGDPGAKNSKSGAIRAMRTLGRSAVTSASWGINSSTPCAQLARDVDRQPPAARQSGSSSES